MVLGQFTSDLDDSFFRNGSFYKKWGIFLKSPAIVLIQEFAVALWYDTLLMKYLYDLFVGLTAKR